LSVVTEYPAWFIIFCILLGGVYAATLYYKNQKEEFSGFTNKWLATFRFLAISIIAFLLLSPLLKTTLKSTEKPLIIFAQDNSQSLITGKDSLYYLNEYPTTLNNAIADLEKDYEVRTYAFADKVIEGIPYDYEGKLTNISAVFDEMTMRYSNRNVGAMVLAGDGIYNAGLNPVYASDQLRFPVFSFALGDTSLQKDLFISKVNFNRIAFLGNDFPVEVIVGGNMSIGQQSKLSLNRGQTTLFSKNINFKSNRYFETVQIQLEADKPGMQRYTVKIEPHGDEVSIVNNSFDIFIDILDARQKILIVGNSPHPDIGTLKTAIESNRAYEVTSKDISEFNEEIAAFNLLILHQLPAEDQNIAKLISDAKAAKIPILYILGAQSNLSQFSRLGSGLQIETDQQNYNEAVPVYDENFVLFTLTSPTRAAMENFPPLMAPFGEYKVANSANVLLYQQIGSLVTGYPLVLFNQTPDEKTGVIAGEGLWKWRLYDFLKNGSHTAFNEIVTKMIQYLSVKAERSFFKIMAQNNFPENEAVVINAEVYNQSYEMINDPDVEITITNSAGDTYPFIFGKTARAYQLNAGLLPVDNYTFEARVRVGDNIFTDEGAFTISPLNIESVNTIADHNLMFQLAQKTGGEMIYPSEITQLPEMLRSRPEITTITYSEKRFSDLVNLPWVFLLILGLLTVEWFIRKRGGSY
jgi:hypothetical protein